MPDYAALGGEVTLQAAGSVSSYQPRITALKGGGFVLTWTMEEPDDSGVYASVFSADGQLVTERITVTGPVRGSQNTPDVTALNGGGFVIVWADFNGITSDADDSGSAIRGQVFTEAGARVGGQFLVNTTVESDQFSPFVDALDSGGFVVTWSDASGNPDPDTIGVRAQQFSATGGKVGAEVVVPALARGDQYANDVAGLPGGGFVAIWADNGAKPGDTSEFGVFARLFDASGVPTSGELPVNTSGVLDQSDAQVAVLDNGNFVVTWHDESGQGGDAEPLSIKAQVFTGAGARAGTEILVNTGTAGSQADAVVTAVPGGGFAISWQDFGADDPATPFATESFIRLQVFDAAGARQGGEQRVNTTDEFDQRNPTITALANGDIVVAWTDPTGDQGATYIRAQAFRLQPSDPGTDDTLNGTRNADTLDGRGGNDILSGLAGNDLLYGGDGNDVLKGGAGDDVLAGGFGTDTADYSDLRGSVSVSLASARYGGQFTGGSGTDTLTGIENLLGSRDGDELSGDAEANRIQGQMGNDVIFGDAGDDMLFGDAGDDVLDGGEGRDVLAGGAGNDRFVFSSFDGDLVKDWQSGEKIDFTAFFGGTLRLEFRYGRTFAGFDNDSNGQFDFGFIEILATGLTQSDFQL